MMAREAASARTILAMGEIAARLQVDQDASRAKFTEMFERFARRSVQRRICWMGKSRPAPSAAAATSLAGAAR